MWHIHIFLFASQKELLDPAVKGTLNLLQSCAKVSSIRRVILTSSTAAVLAKPELNKDSFVDESWFSNPSYCEEQKVQYPAITNSVI